MDLNNIKKLVDTDEQIFKENFKPIFLLLYDTIRKNIVGGLLNERLAKCFV
jgi:hypothetical protein